MDQQRPIDASNALAAALQARAHQEVVLRLYVAGASQRSTAAISALLQLCEQHLAGRYQLEILDIYQHADQALADAILATPTLLLLAPIVGRYFVGDLQQPERLLAALGLSGAPSQQREEHSRDQI
jgi:circadian clock protein KaiB